MSVFTATGNAFVSVKGNTKEEAVNSFISQYQTCPSHVDNEETGDGDELLGICEACCKPIFDNEDHVTDQEGYQFHRSCLL